MDAIALGRLGSCTAVMVGLIVAVACTNGKREATAIVLPRPECPMDSLDIQVVDTVHGVASLRHITTIPLAGAITNIPEFHDCQRFIGTAGGMKYGPLVAIFANHQLDSLYSPQSDPEVGAKQAAAQIYSYDGPYDKLAIRQGFNCLYLMQSNTGWDAFMTSVGNDESACQKPLVNGYRLSVVHKRLVHDDRDVPPVARWDYDTVTHWQYIGIRCGGEWCEVGHRGFETSAGYPDAKVPNDPIPSMGAAHGNERVRVVRVKGWYDEQYLAEGSTGSLKPTQVRGTAFPHSLLDRMNNETMFAGGWKPVAYLLLDGDPGVKYKTKLNLERGTNKVFYCFGSFSDCEPTGAAPEPTCEAEADHKWWAKIESGQTHDVKFYCVTRRTHPNGDEIPGAVRWRWDEDDEKLWVRCPQGCCTVN